MPGQINLVTPYNNIRSKLNRAVAAYLVSVGVGSTSNILIGNNVVVKSYPCLIVKTTVGKPEIGLIGIYRCQVSIDVRGSAAVQNVPGEQKDTMEQSQLDDFTLFLSQTHDALMVTDGVSNQSLYRTAQLITAAGRALSIPDQADNADMADLTVGDWYDAGFGDGEPDEAGCSWRELLLFEAQICGFNVD